MIWGTPTLIQVLTLQECRALCVGTIHGRWALINFFRPFALSTSSSDKGYDIYMTHKKWGNIRNIRKVRKRRHHYLEFGHTQGEIQKKPAKQYISILPTIKMVHKFFFPESLHCCYIDFHCSYLYSYYNSSRILCIKCWDSAFRTEFQHFILRFNKISLLYRYY
jgi:hypothetical protein